jgi:hypothetical protein
MKQNKIYIGPLNLANLSYHLENALISIGLKADFITWSNIQHPFYSKSKSYKLFDKPPFKIFNKNIFYLINEMILKPFYFLVSLLKYDTFIFMYPYSYLQSNIDLKILKLFRKKIITIFTGCLERDTKFDSSKDYICNLCKDYELQFKCSCNDIEKKVYNINKFIKFTNIVIGLPDSLSYIKNNVNTKTLRFCNGLILEEFSKKNYYGKIRISHLPSNPLAKGTNYIKDTLALLQKEYDIEVCIKDEMWSRGQLQIALEESHIVIDSVLGYTFGVLSLEAIQYGAIALNNYPDWIADLYELQPVVKVTPDTLYDVLKNMLENRDIIYSHRQQQIKAYQKYFTYQSAGNYYKELLQLK